MKLSEEKMNIMWLYSDNIIKRSFSILGHYFLAYLVIMVCVGILAAFFAGLAVMFE